MTAAGALKQLEEEHGFELVLVGPCPGGEVGAQYARGRDGREFVFKWTDNREDMAYFERIVHRVSRLRTRGYPAPGYLAPFIVQGGVVVVQEAVTGRWRDDISQELVGTVLQLNRLQKGAADETGHWTDYIRMTLTDGAAGYCLHETLRDHSPESRRLLEWVRSVGRHLGSLPEGDLVHVDFHHRNMLREGEELVAVVDWEGCRPGDRAFDLVTFCFGMTHASPADGADTRVWEQASQLASAEALAAYVAHMALRRVDWSIRHHPEEVDRTLGLSFDYLRRVA